MVVNEDLEAVKTRAANVESHPRVMGSRASERKSLQDAMGHGMFGRGGVVVMPLLLCRCERVSRDNHDGRFGVLTIDFPVAMPPASR